MTLKIEAPVRVAAGRHAPRGRFARIVLGPPEHPRWARPALLAVLALAAALYTWGLGRNGYANDYYAAAVLSGTRSWKAFFFGALDSGSFITVDKPPFALWVMGLSARIFGFGTWSMLLPQALAGVATTGVLYSAVRRAFDGPGRAARTRRATGPVTGSVTGPVVGPVIGSGRGSATGHAAGLLAALVMTLTPITVAINRDNNPDTILVLLLVAAAWACAEAVRTGRPRLLVLCGVLVGMGFTTKMLQAYLVLPGFALVYLLAAPAGMWRRVGHLAVAGAALVVSSAWWMVVVDLWPAGDRPYVGGSTDGTVWDLVIGYNGLGRIFGGEGGPGGGPGGGGPGGGGGFGGQAGAGRLFNEIMAGQISWLIPFAVLALVTGLLICARRRGPVKPHVGLLPADAAWTAVRRPGVRAALLLWGGWLVVHYAVFSFSAGIFHPYYATALAPAVAALTGIGGVLMWRAYRSRRPVAGWALPLGVAATGAWAFIVLRRTPGWAPWLPFAVAAACAAAVLGLVVLRLGRRGRARLAAVALVLALVGGLAGPAAYALTPLSAPVNGTNPTAGPQTGFGGMGVGPRGAGGPDGPGGADGRPAGAEDGVPPGAGTSAGAPGGTRTPAGVGAPPSGGLGGPEGGVDAALVSYLRANKGTATWLVAVSSAREASSIILATGGGPVIAMGGFTGSDPAMTVEKLRRYVAEGRLMYVLLGGRMGGPGERNDEVTAWVRANGTAVPAEEYGGTGTGGTLYRLG
ncbi:glycosyltransferase family 39 protein [Sphaerisporangium sp. NPDC051011]|uniref:glycosyltransferase family 39 protein n=1 Tax=Sphaerisporangium sp. NPDC051011 TaxID=3155792 RepID=UPI003409A2E4